MHAPFGNGKNVFDIGALAAPESFPPKWPAGYFDLAGIQQALGVPLDFTGNSPIASITFNLTGDFCRGGRLATLSILLDEGVKIVMIYGDRDHQDEERSD
ncbi:hypothetical protein CC78DRAFT_584917 [Lojkania enalia]|uniref:Uncharacterized protein n=1 Tax=Lojkania enalia TaxID=147567 RepID=A0A9P4K1G7_9PLEO|nr:hypothetical protein CC78DRAFT_584917 [Didymosphaeria enalia]